MAPRTRSSSRSTSANLRSDLLSCRSFVRFWHLALEIPVNSPWSRRCGAMVAALLLAALECGEQHPAAPQPDLQPPNPAPAIPHHVLFIGNSLTAANDLPTMVEGLAHTVGIDSFSTESIAIGGFSL